MIVRTWTIRSEGDSTKAITIRNDKLSERFEIQVKGEFIMLDEAEMRALEEAVNEAVNS